MHLTAALIIALTLLGSAIVLVSVVAYCINGIRSERRLLVDQSNSI